MSDMPIVIALSIALASTSVASGVFGVWAIQRRNETETSASMFVQWSSGFLSIALCIAHILTLAWRP